MGFNPFKVFKKKEDEVIDLGKLHENISGQKKTENTTETEQGQGLGFIGNLASASTSSDSTENETRTNAMDPDKIDRFGRRLDRILGRMELIERKIERIEHRMDIK